MTTILDDQLYLHSNRLAGKVVLITGERPPLTCICVPMQTGTIGVDQPFSGGGAGIGRETALQCAKFKYVVSCLPP
jgi:hypothetical protein